MNDILTKIKNGLDKAFNSIKSFGERAFAPQLEYADHKKLKGNKGERIFYNDISEKFGSEVKILTNIVIIDNNRVIGELDTIIIYNNKIFAIEVKNYSGHIYENNGKLIKDNGYGNIDSYNMPIHQLSSNVYKLKNSMDVKGVWINEIVYFVDNEDINLPDDFIWFNNIDDIANYIVNEGKSTPRIVINRFLHNIVCCDEIIGLNNDRIKQGRIVRKVLHVKTKDNVDYELDLNKVRSIHIKHNIGKDELEVIMCDGVKKVLTTNNASITIKDYKSDEEVYNLSRLNEIYLAEVFD